MSDLLALFRTFVRTVETGSFTAVARELNASQPTVSRQIALLERHFGCLLFRRTTRALTLTDDGRVLYDHARRSLDAVTEAESAVGRRKGKPSGTLRLSCAVVFGRLHVVPRLPRFMAQYSDVEIDLSMSDGFSDLVEEGIDLSIRVGALTDPGLVAKRIGTTRRVVVAAPAYLARRGRPRTPDDLRGHDCIVYTRLAAGANWSFRGAGGGQVSVPIAGRFRVNSTEGVRAAVLQGLGIGYVPIWHFADREIETGRLEVLLADHETPGQPISAIYPSRRHLSPKVRAMIDFLASEFETDPQIGAGTA